MPLLKSFDSIPDCSAAILVVSCSADISSEKKATTAPSEIIFPFLSVFTSSFCKVSENFFATLNPILVAKAVFPIAGLPANIIKSDFCKPPRALSKSLNPVDKPAKPPDD